MSEGRTVMEFRLKELENNVVNLSRIAAETGQSQVLVALGAVLDEVLRTRELVKLQLELL